MTMRSKCHVSPDNVATFGVLTIGVKVLFRFNTKAPRSSVLTKVSHEMASPEGIGHFFLRVAGVALSALHVARTLAGAG